MTGYAEVRNNTSRNSPVSSSGIAMALNRWPIAILLFIIALARAGFLWKSLDTNFNPEDFSIYYCAALTLARGENPYRTDMAPLAKSLGLEKGYIAQTNNPPTLLVILEPLTLLSPHQAYWAWQAVNAIAFAAALYLLLWPAYSGLSPPMAISLAAFAILFPPVGNCFSIAQSKMLVLLPLAAMVRFMDRKRNAMAGLMLAITGLLHVFPLLLGGYLVLTRRWRMTGYCIGAMAIGGFATIAIAGVGNSLGFFTAIRSLSSERWLSEPSNIALAASISRTFWWLSGSATGSAAEAVRRASVIGVDLAVMFLVVKTTLMNGRDDRDWRVFSLWIVASVMVSPTAWFHYMLLMLIPFAQMARAASHRELSARTLAMAVGCYLMTALAGDALQLASRNLLLVRQFRELESLCLLMAFVAAYWFATDAPDLTLAQSIEPAVSA